MHELLTKDTFVLYCTRHYDGRYCATMDDFNEDLNKIKYIRKLVTRYETTGELKERLILNHLIVLNNVFGAVAASRIIYFKLRDQFKVLKPFLSTIGILPDHYYNIDHEGSIVITNMIETDPKVEEALKEL